MTDMLYIVPADGRGLQPIFQFKTLEGDFCEGSCVCAVLGRGALVDDLIGPHDGKHLHEVELFMKTGAVLFTSLQAQEGIYTALRRRR